jgi:hypothetical protein
MTKASIVQATGELMPFTEALEKLPELTDDEITRMTFERVAAAPALEDAMKAPGESESLGDFEGHLVKIHAAWKRESEIKESAIGWYVVLDLEDGLGTRRVVSSGSPQPMAVVARAVAEDKLPLEGRVVLGRKKEGRSAPVFLAARERVAGDLQSEPF